MFSSHRLIAVVTNSNIVALATTVVPLDILDLFMMLMVYLHSSNCSSSSCSTCNSRMEHVPIRTHVFHPTGTRATTTTTTTTIHLVLHLHHNNFLYRGKSCHSGQCCYITITNYYYQPVATKHCRLVT